MKLGRRWKASSMKKNNIKELYFKYKKQSVFFVLLFTGLFLLLIGLYWLVFALLLLFGFYTLIFSIKIFKNTPFINTATNFIFIVLLAVFCRVFIFEVYMIPSKSMEDALFPGDIILVSKLNYGPKLPRRPQDIPWINLFFENSSQLQKEGKNSAWPYRRLPGFSTIKNGDIVVFKKPDDDSDFLIKRCIGIPGDKFQMKNSEVLINDNITFQLPTVKKDYQFNCANSLFVQKLADSLHFKIKKQQRTGNSYLIIANLNYDQFTTLKTLKGILDIKPAVKNWQAYPWKGNTGWTIDNMGPFTIPYKGMKISLKGLNYFLYQTIIKNSEHVQLKKLGNNYFINEHETSTYTFNQNYYFMLGDNRDDSSDSRFWGYVAESDITGRQIVKLF
ncbi:MAG TPA: signal peptidase I [Pelobium sp.]|nr:signal peptidase I [Pelobium sp.]